MSDKSDAKARKLDLRSTVLKELSNYPPKHFKQVTLSILGLLRNATPHDSASLTGHPHWRRIDVGEYRIIYHFDADTVYVSVVGKRNDAEVYRLLKR